MSRRRLRRIVAIALCLLPLAGTARAQLLWDVSVKFVDDVPAIAPDNCPASVPPNRPGMDTEAKVVASIAYANDVLDRLGRGYRLRLKPGPSGLTQTISPNAPTPTGIGATSWERSDVNGTALAAWHANVEGSTCVGNSVTEGIACSTDGQCGSGGTCENTFAYDPSAINVYILSRCEGGFSATRNVGDDLPIVIMGQNVQGAQLRILHEAGHVLGVCHTHGCPNSSPPISGTQDATCTADKATSCSATTNDTDDVSSDTLCDCANWDDEQALASGAFRGESYADLATPDKRDVLDTLFNVMSYHVDNDSAFRSDVTCSIDVVDRVEPGCTIDSTGQLSCPSLPAPSGVFPCRYQLSADQLDRATDRSNCAWPNMASGRTWFVGANPGPNPVECPTVTPSATIAEALGKASSGEVITLWPGTYRDTLDLTSPITLRSSHGTATIRP